jgi:hypothetical protein
MKKISQNTHVRTCTVIKYVRGLTLIEVLEDVGVDCFDAMAQNWTVSVVNFPDSITVGDRRSHNSNRVASYSRDVLERLTETEFIRYVEQLLRLDLQHTTQIAELHSDMYLPERKPLLDRFKRQNTIP